MCGIVGVLCGAGVDAEVLGRMRDRLAHRGPDHSGLWRSADGQVGLGHRRLAIIDLDARANQPMVSADGRFVVTYNGEIYNFRGIRRRLEAEGVPFRTDSDTEVLVEAYRRWGEACLAEFSGMFAFALWDRDESRLFCARDRAGEKPFHYACVDGTFLFGSELKALVEWPGFARHVDYEAMIDFLAFGFVTDPRTIWRNVRKLPPAHAMVVDFRDGRALAREPFRYWALPLSAQGAGVDAEEIRAALLRAADEMSIADVPLGTFLSGGVDSSTVTAALALSGHDVRSFTIGFDDPAYDERPWSRQVAERYRTTHQERRVTPGDMVAVLDRLAWHYDEPFSDYSSIPTYYLCREARGAITVALSGDGADELFAGYTKYQRLARRAGLAGILPPGLARLLSGAAGWALPAASPLRRTLAQYGMESPAMLADMLCHGFPLARLQQVARGPLAAALAHYDPHCLVAQLLADAPPREVGLVNAMRHLDFALTLPGDMLVKVDRASMAVALEVRPLFLHRDVMELAARIPPAALASPGAGKRLLKAAVRPWLPEALIARPKQGFALPLPKWLAGESDVAAAVRARRTDGPLAGLLDMDHVAWLAESQARGAGTFTAMVYSTFVLDQWFRKWQPAA